MRTTNRILTTIAGAALLAASCATTSFTSSWKAPDAQPLTFKAGDKVVALVVSKNSAIRRAGETALVGELNKRGLVGVPSYSLVSEVDAADESKAKVAIDTTGAVGVVAMRPVGTEQKISSTPSAGYYGSPYYGGFWGGGYYGYGWGGASEIRTDTYVSIETLVYDLRQNKLVWAGQSKTMNPSEVDKFVVELAGAVSKELQKAGLTSPPAK
jgi:hypothetical protein